MKKFLAFSLSGVVFIMLINVEMPTIVSILKFMSRINFVLSWVEHEKSFVTSSLGQRILNQRPFNPMAMMSSETWLLGSSGKTLTAAASSSLAGFLDASLARFKKMLRWLGATLAV